MVGLKYIYKKFVNLGYFSRVLLITVKPLALWFSIQLDTDSGLSTAQIFLIALLFVSLSETNAHKSFYLLHFSIQEPTYSKDVARSYIDYVQKITLQLIFIIIISILIISMLYWGSYNVIIMGIFYSIAEKINSEFNRYAQFCNNSKSLFYLALSKLIPVLLAVLLSYLALVDISYAFSVLSLLSSFFVNWTALYLSIYYFIKILRRSFFLMFKKSFNFIYKDIFQISCAFAAMSFFSIDKWLLQYFSKTDFPMYMLFTQFASVLVTIQYVLFISPVRVRLINEKPQEIRSIKIYSPIISLMSLMVGIALYSYNYTVGESNNIGYFPFFFAALSVFAMAYEEHLYWLTTARVRLALDVLIVFLFVISFFSLKKILPSTHLMIYTLWSLFCFMLIRVLMIIYLTKNIKSKYIS